MATAFGHGATELRRRADVPQASAAPTDCVCAGLLQCSRVWPPSTRPHTACHAMCSLQCAMHWRSLDRISVHWRATRHQLTLRRPAAFSQAHTVTQSRLGHPCTTGPQVASPWRGQSASTCCPFDRPSAGRCTNSSRYSQWSQRRNRRLHTLYLIDTLWSVPMFELKCWQYMLGPLDPNQSASVPL